MQKKIAAGLTIAIFLISTFAIVVPVSAHFTLGNYTSTYPYHTSDYDPHVSGIIGYVWPGAGPAEYQGVPLSNSGSPGYVPPYPTQSWINGGFTAPTNWAQLDGDEYAPFGAVLTGSTGDLIFAINATTDFNGGAYVSFTRLYIFLPPEFTLTNPGAASIVTTITNNYYAAIRGVSRLSPFDRFAPNYTAIQIRADNIPDRVSGAGRGIIFNTSAGDQWYYVRINGVVAPTVAGKYFFKMYLRHGNDASYFVPVQNWPVMLVKGEIDPGIMTGTIRYGGWNATLYNTAIAEPGQVWAQMTTRLDPYTGQQRPDLPVVNAQGYFNATAQGHYEVEGMAPGIYDVYASAAGYPQTKIASGVTVLKGQSIHFDGLLQPGAVIHGDVNSKHQFGVEPWPYDSYVKIELYNQPTNSHVPTDSSGNSIMPVSWSPLPCVAGGQDIYMNNPMAVEPVSSATASDAAAGCGDPRTASQIAFPWHEWLTSDGFPGTSDGFTYDFSLSSQSSSPFPSPVTTSTLTTDPMGVGPAQNWFVKAGTTDPFNFEFGLKGEFGAPTTLSGEVPQLFATWINGLTPGRYYARAWVFRYVQTALDGTTFQEYSFDVTPQEWAGDITLPIDLRLSSWVNKTVHFHNEAGTITTDNITSGAGDMVGGLYGGPYGDKGLASWNVTTLNLDQMNTGNQYMTWYGLNDTWLGQISKKLLTL